MVSQTYQTRPQHQPSGQLQLLLLQRPRQLQQQLLHQGHSLLLLQLQPPQGLHWLLASLP